MNNETKYFYPDYEDVHIGWEGEVHWNRGYDEIWEPIKIAFADEMGIPTGELDNVLTYCIWDRCSEIRTPFLTRQQIEDEGWTHMADSIDMWFDKMGDWDMGSWTGRRAVIHYGFHDQRLYISVDDYGTHHKVFEGKCLDINTFRKIIKLVLIDNE